MPRTGLQLLVKVEQRHRTTHYRMTGRDRLLIGQDPTCDVVVYGEKYPKKYSLFTGHKNYFQINLQKQMPGEVVANDAVLRFDQLIAHDLLPLEKGRYVYRLTSGKKGTVRVGDALITFQCVAADRVASQNVDLVNFKGFSWTAVTFRHLTSDLPFKFILLSLFVANFFLINYLNGIPIDLNKHRNTNVVPDRLVRIIVRNQPVAPSRKRQAVVAGDENGEKNDTDRPKKQSEKGAKSVRPENLGLLGLLTGKGKSNQSGSLTEFLLDKGLVKDLNDVLASTDLKVGKGATNGDQRDALLATSDLGQGIDDILKEVEDTESFSLGRRGELQFDKIGGMTGSDVALGRRSEASVQTVIQKNKGRLLYIYKKYLKHNPDFAGKLVIEIVIAASGDVSKIQVVETNMQSVPEFQREVLSFIRRWKFPPIEAGTVTVNFPLFFHKVG